MPSGGSWTGYGHDSYGLCIDHQGNVWETALRRQHAAEVGAQRDAPGNVQPRQLSAQGCAVDAHGDVWVAHSLVGP